MRTLTIHNKKLREYLLQKDELVKEGRKKSVDIELLEKEIEELDAKEKKIIESVEPKELIEEGETLKKEINTQIEKIEELGNKIMQMKLDAIPKEMMEKHTQMRKSKEELERERNKLALKVQKIKDRAIPIIQKEVKPLLEEYDDIETATLDGEKIIVNCFNHLDVWKQNFAKKK